MNATHLCIIKPIFHSVKECTTSLTKIPQQCRLCNRPWGQPFADLLSSNPPTYPLLFSRLITSPSLHALKISLRQHFCILTFLYFLLSPALSGPYGPGSPSVLLLCISGELCFCWFMPDLSHILYFKFLRVRIWLAHLFVASHASGHGTICSWVILECGVHCRGVRERAQQRLAVRGADSSRRQDSGLAWG